MGIHVARSEPGCLGWEVENLVRSIGKARGALAINPKLLRCGCEQVGAAIVVQIHEKGRGRSGRKLKLLAQKLNFLRCRCTRSKARAHKYKSAKTCGHAVEAIPEPALPLR